MVKKNISNNLRFLFLVCDLDKVESKNSTEFRGWFNSLGYESNAINSRIRELKLKELEINYWIGFSNIVLKEVKIGHQLLILQDCGIKINHINTLRKITKYKIY